MVQMCAGRQQHKKHQLRKQPKKQIELEDRLFRWIGLNERRGLFLDGVKTGSDNEEDDFNDFSMNKGFIQYDL